MRDGRGSNELSRRSFLSAGSAAAAGIWFGGRMAWAQAAAAGDRLVQQRAAAATAKITVLPLRNNLSLVTGSGGNIAVLAGAAGKAGTDGKVMVDSGYSSSQPVMQLALNGINADPVKMLINTHWHPDHTDGNVWVHDAGATIFAQTKTRERLSMTEQVAAFGMTVPALPAAGLPTEVFDDAKTLTANQSTIKLVHYAPAHTDTDISVHFVEADVLHVGDTWFNGMYPFIDYGSGGSIGGMIRATEANLAGSNGKTMILPGHGPLGTRAQLADWYLMLQDCRDAVTAMKKSGKPLAEVQAAKPTAKFDERYGGGSIKPDVFVGFVYQGV